jgi:hypothetical protein
MDLAIFENLIMLNERVAELRRQLDDCAVAQRAIVEHVLAHLRLIGGLHAELVSLAQRVVHPEDLPLIEGRLNASWQGVIRAVERTTLAVPE